VDVLWYPIFKHSLVLSFEFIKSCLDFPRAHLASENDWSSVIVAKGRVDRAHHVFLIEQLVYYLINCGILARVKGTIAVIEKMKSRKRNKIYTHLPQISVELSWKSKRTSHSTHNFWDQFVRIRILARSYSHVSEAIFVQRLVVEDHAHVCILDKVVTCKDGVVGLYYYLRDRSRRKDGICCYDFVRIVLS